ncbi:hypothetical protein EDB84DRAFT_1529485, partial [Lactarius hengduanensis]
SPLATAGLAAPSRRATTSSSFLPICQQQLFVTLGVGNQNYTCSSSGNYHVFDVAPLFSGPEIAFATWSSGPCDNRCPTDDPLEPSLAQKFQAKFNVSVSGQHYFIANPDGSLAPPFGTSELTDRQGNPDAIVIAAQLGYPITNCPPPSAWITPDIQVKFTLQVFLYGSQV